MENTNNDIDYAALARELAMAAEHWLLETGPGMRINTASGPSKMRQALKEYRKVVPHE